MQLEFQDGKLFDLDPAKQRINVGRDPSNDLVIDSEDVARFHACLLFEEGKLFVVDLGSDGTYLNDKLLTARVALVPSDRLRFGQTELSLVDEQRTRVTVVVPPPGMDKPIIPLAVLHLTTTGAGPVRVEVRGPLTIGRASGNNMVLKSDAVSSRHAEIRIEEGAVTIVDLKSTNGTYVNDIRVEQQVLQNGDRLSFEKVEYLVEIPPPAEDFLPMDAKASRGAGQDAFGRSAGASGFESPSRPDALSKGWGTSVPRPQPPPPPPPSPPVEPPVQKISTPAPPVKSPPVVSFTPPLMPVPPAKPAPPVRMAPPSAPASPGKAVHEGASRQMTPPSSGTPSFASQAPTSQEVGDLSNLDLKKLLFSFEGRISRLTFFVVWIAIVLAVFLVISISFAALISVGDTAKNIDIKAIVFLLIVLITILLVIWPFVAVSVKRFHDINQSGVWCFAYLVPFAGIILLNLAMLFVPGTRGPNRFGPPPA